MSLLRHVWLYDASGNPISSTGTSLDTNITNEPSVNVQDGAGNDLTSTVNVDRTTNLDGLRALNVNGIMYGRVSDTVVKASRLDASTEALITVSYEHHELHDGTHFYIDNVQELAINDVFDLQITTPNTTKWGHFIFEISAESETEWLLYEGATVLVAGTASPVFNNNRNSATVSTMVINSQLNSSIANANADTSVAAATAIRHGILGSGKGNAGQNQRGAETILKQNTVYCFRFIAIAAGYINYDINFYEHTDRN